MCKTLVQCAGDALPRLADQTHTQTLPSTRKRKPNPKKKKKKKKKRNQRKEKKRKEKKHCMVKNKERACSVCGVEAVSNKKTCWSDIHWSEETDPVFDRSAEESAVTEDALSASVEASVDAVAAAFASLLSVSSFFTAEVYEIAR